MVSAGVQWGVVQRSPHVVLTQITGRHRRDCCRYQTQEVDPWDPRRSSRRRDPHTCRPRRSKRSSPPRLRQEAAQETTASARKVNESTVSTGTPQEGVGG